MEQNQPAVMVDDGSGNPVDRKNLRTAAWGGLIGTALEQYDFVIYGTATAIVFNRIFFPNAEPTIGVIAGFATYAVGFLAQWPCVRAVSRAALPARKEIRARRDPVPDGHLDVLDRCAAHL